MGPDWQSFKEEICEWNLIDSTILCVIGHLSTDDNLWILFLQLW